MRPEQFLVPTLKPGDVVILDNLGSHKGKAVRRRSEPFGRASCSCPYSPDLNPIEKVFAKNPAEKGRRPPDMRRPKCRSL
jgi:transposase